MKSPARVTCLLCAHVYEEHAGLTCHQGCPLSHGCRLLKCPRCGYEMPAPTRLTRLLTRWLGAADAPAGGR